jgi:hypothetical protein
MSKRFGLAVVTAIALTALAAALAPAHINRHKTKVPMYFDSNPPGGTFYVNLDSGFIYCEQDRLVKLFKDGVKIQQSRSDRYGKVVFGITPATPGAYRAVATRKRLPLQHRPGKRHKRICRAGTSPTVTLPVNP